MFSHGQFGVVAENSNRRISIFDTGTLKVLQQIPLDADVIDVAITSGCARAVVTSFSSKTMFQIDLRARPARVVASALSTTVLEDVALTGDNRFALAVDGSSTQIQNIVSYSLRQNAFVSAIPANAQAVAVSPADCSLVLTAEYQLGSVHRYTINSEGILVDTGQSFPAGQNPDNIVFSPDGLFAFVVNYSGGVSVLSTLNPDAITLLETVSSSQGPQSLALTKNGLQLYVLTIGSVDIYAFDPVAGSLTLLRSFTHGLDIAAPYYGVDQIALSQDETRLFISAYGQVAVFTTYGLPLGTVAGASGPGGLDICRRICEDREDPCENEC